MIARLNVGGPARHVVWLTSALEDDEFQSKLIAGTVPAGERDMAHIAEAAGVQPLFIKEMSRELSFRDVISLWKVYREIRREKPDIIHTHTAKAGTVGRLAAFLYRWTSFNSVKVVHTFHGHVFHSYYGRTKTRIFLTIEKLLASLATDKIIVISPQQFREIHEHFRIGRRDQFEVIPLGIDVASFTGSPEKRIDFRKEIGAGDKQLLVGFVGRLTEIKNISLLLRSIAASSRDEQHGESGLQCVIVGDGQLRPALESETRDLGIARLVSFLGDRRDPENAYAGVDIIALTSLNEGTPLSLIEAMASRRPVISTLVGGVPDLLGEVVEYSDGFEIRERGIGVPSADEKAFARGLRYLAQHQDLRSHLSHAGRIFVEEHYEKERLVNDIKSLYRNLLK